MRELGRVIGVTTIGNQRLMCSVIVSGSPELHYKINIDQKLQKSLNFINPLTSLPVELTSYRGTN